MRTVGITGHINLTVATRSLVADQIIALLRQEVGCLTGMTSLAGGADQIFADAVLAVGGSLTFVQPCQRIEETFSPTDLEHYRALRPRVSDVIAMPYDEPSEEAFETAGQHISDHCDLLLAVWDGEAAASRGGTADIVAHRRASGRPLLTIWPDGAARG